MPTASQTVSSSRGRKRASSSSQSSSSAAASSPPRSRPRLTTINEDEDRASSDEDNEDDEHADEIQHGVTTFENAPIFLRVQFVQYKQKTPTKFTSDYYYDACELATELTFKSTGADLNKFVTGLIEGNEDEPYDGKNHATPMYSRAKSPESLEKKHFKSPRQGDGAELEPIPLRETMRVTCRKSCND